LLVSLTIHERRLTRKSGGSAIATEAFMNHAGYGKYLGFINEFDVMRALDAGKDLRSLWLKRSCGRIASP
jgi:hypothetical protein